MSSLLFKRNKKQRLDKKDWTDRVDDRRKGVAPSSEEHVYDVGR